MKATKGILWATVLSLVLLSGTVSVSAEPILSLDPVSSQVAVGSFFDVYFDISGVNDLYSFQFDISYDPTVLSARNIMEGDFLPAGGATLFIPGAIDNMTGTISFTADLLFGQASGVSGVGHLAEIEFQALAPGTSLLTLSNLVFLDSNLADIYPSDICNGTVTVNGGASPVPESSTILLCGAGLAGLGAYRFRTRD